MRISHEIFKKTTEERIKLLQMKRKNIANRRAEFGKDWKKHLNSQVDYHSAKNP